MIILTNTKKLQVVLAGNAATNQLAFTTSYADLGTTLFSASSSDGLTNNTTPVVIVPSPTGNQRQLKFISIYNIDTITHSVTIQLNDNGTIYNVFSGYLMPNYTLIYNNDRGFVIYNNYGSEVTSSSNSGTSFTFTLNCTDGEWTPICSSDYIFGTRYGYQPSPISSYYLPSSLVPSSLMGNYYGFYMPVPCTIKSVSLSAGYISSAANMATLSSVYLIKNNTQNILIDDNVDFSIINYKSDNTINEICGQGDYITGLVVFGQGQLAPTGMYLTLMCFCE